MDNQEVFNKVWNGLKGQNFELCVNGAGNCVYRGPTGLKCAAGHVFTDEQLAAYDVKYANERTTYHEPSFYAPASRIIKALELSIDSTLMDALQSAHDSLRNGSKMESALRYVASQYNLTVPE